MLPLPHSCPYLIHTNPWYFPICSSRIILAQHITVGTHRLRHMLDLVISRSSEAGVGDVSTDDLGISNHHAATCHFQFQRPRYTFTMAVFIISAKSTTLCPSAFLSLAPYLPITFSLPLFPSPTCPLKSAPVTTLPVLVYCLPLCLSHSRNLSPPIYSPLAGHMHWLHLTPPPILFQALQWSPCQTPSLPLVCSYCTLSDLHLHH